MTPDFFPRLIEKGYLANFDRSRGKLDNYLLTLFERFLSNQQQRRGAAKRGGAARQISLDAPPEDGSHDLSVLVDCRTPEIMLERQGAEAIVDRAISSLRAEAGRRGKQRLFEALLPSVEGESFREAPAVLTEHARLSPGAGRMAVLRYRRRVQQLVYKELAERGIRDGEATQQVARWLVAFS